MEIGRPGARLSGVAGHGALVFASITAQSATAAAAQPGSPTTTVAAFRLAVGAAPIWHADLAGHGGPLVVAGNRVVCVLGGSGTAAGLAVRGEPGAALAALDAATGALGWTLAVDATDWAVIEDVAATGDGVVIGGAFSGTLRIADQVLSSAGLSDGFVARVTASGGIAWLVGIGGPGADAVHGVAAAGDRIAVAGTFTAGADLLGEPLAPFDARSRRADGFVAALDASGARRWAQSFGGKADDAIAGVAIDRRGRIAVAASAQDTVQVGGTELTASGSADGMVAWWNPDGTAITAVLLGGPDFDGLRAIAAAGDHVVVAGFYSGAIRLGDRALTAGGGDDAFLAELDASGAVAEAWPVSGDGREEITALGAIPGGFVAGVAHTAGARIDTAGVPAPSEPTSGAAILVRPLR